MQSESRSIELTRNHRSQYIEKLIKEAPELFATLVSSKLLPANVLSKDVTIEELQKQIEDRDVNEIEGILFRDPFVCSSCGKHIGGDQQAAATASLPPAVTTRVCPVTNQPHRRLLIEVAFRFLNLAAEARASIVITQDPVPAIPTSGSMSTMTSPITASPNSINQNYDGSQFPNNTVVDQGRQKIRRPMPRKPHLLVLAFHAASRIPEADQQQHLQNDEMRGLATNLLVTMCNIYRTISEDRSTAQNFTRRIQRLLIIFDRTWRSYVLRSIQDLAATQQQQQQQDLQKQEQDNNNNDSPPPRARTPPADRSDSNTTVVASQQQQQQQDQQKEQSQQQQAKVKSSSDHDGSTSPEPAFVMKPVAPSGFNFAAALRGISSRVPAATTTTTTTTTTASSSSNAPPPLPPATVYVSASTAMVDHDGRAQSVSTDEESDNDRQQQQLAHQRQQLSPEQQQQMAMNLLLEQKRRGEEAAAREAYAARVRMRQQNSFADGNQKIQKLLDSISEEAESKVFLEELQHRPPKLHRIPVLLRRITESLIGVIPSTRLKQQLERELHDVLDWDVLKHAGPEVVARVMRYVIGKVIELGAPAREETLRKELDALVDRLQTEEPSTVIVDSIRFLRASVRMLGEDILKAQLAMVRPELAKRALTLQRKYMDEWMATPPKWIDSTKAWVRKHIVEKLLPASSSSASTSEQQQEQQEQHHLNWDQLKVALCDGLLDLLRSSGRPGNQPRWGEYPTELLYFDKPVIFTTANQIQMLVVRMMIMGTCRTILKSYMKTPAVVTGQQQQFVEDDKYKFLNWTQIQIFESKLDKQIVEWLTGSDRMSISQLKDSVEAEVQFFLNQTAHQQNNSNNGNNDDDDTTMILLKSPHVVALRGVMDQMIDVNSAVYSTFEKKVLKVIASLIRKELHKRSVSRGANFSEDIAHRQENADELATLGNSAVTGDVSNCVLDLCDMIEHHVAVYALHYEFVLSQGGKY